MSYSKFLKLLNTKAVKILLDDKYSLQSYDVDEEGGVRIIFDDTDGYEYDVYFDQNTSFTIVNNKISFMDYENKEYVDVYVYECRPVDLNSEY